MKKIIRCNECGMSIEVNDSEFMVRCPICNRKNVVANCEVVPSMDTSLYHMDSPQHQESHVYVDRVEEEQNQARQAQSHMTVSDPSKQVKSLPQAVIVVIFVLFCVFFILMSVFAE